MAADFSLEKMQQGKNCVLKPKGKFSFPMHKLFSEAVKSGIADPGTEIIVIDLAGTNYMDSSALGMLLLARERTLDAKKKIALRGASGTVKNVLAIANFEKLFECQA